MTYLPKIFSVHEQSKAASLANHEWSTILENQNKNNYENISFARDCQHRGIALPSTFLMFVPFLYHLILQDATLATLLVRPSGLYLEDISNETMLSDKNYGSVNRVYIISKQDKLYTEDYQRWIIENNPPKEVKEIEGSDHMLMLSKPLELCNCLLEIAEKYA